MLHTHVMRKDVHTNYLLIGSFVISNSGPSAELVPLEGSFRFDDFCFRLFSSGGAALRRYSHGTQVPLREEGVPPS